MNDDHLDDENLDPDGVDAPRGDVEQLRRERDLLAARVATLESRRVERWRLRRRAAVTLVSGPYRWAVALRSRAARLVRQVADGVVAGEILLSRITADVDAA